MQMLNDWAIGKFLRLVLVVSLVAFISIMLDIPILRQISAFIYFCFLPGVLILRVLNIHKISPIESLLYSVGLSLTFLMLTGLAINTLYPGIGISRPISTLPLLITVSVLLLILCLVVYWRDRNTHDPQPLNLRVKPILSPPVLFLLSLPLLSILGTYVANSYGNSILLFLVIAMVALTVLLVAVNRFIPQELYPLAILMIAISLLFHSSLISTSLVGYDSRIEYFFYKTVEINGYWSSTFPYTIPTNSVLSVTILPAILTSQLGIEGMPLFKIVYPLFLALAPLGVYQAVRVQTSDKIAFLSAILVMSYFEFFGEMPFILKQGIAMFFVVLIVLVILNKTVETRKLRLLFLIFSAGLVVSHYATVSLVIIWLLLTIPITYWLKCRNRVLTKVSIMFLIVVIFSWYMLTANAIFLSAIVGSALMVGRNIANSTLGPETLEAMAVGIRLVSPIQTPLRLIGRIWFIVFYLFMFIGILKLIVERKRAKFYPEFIALSLACFLTLCVHLFVPFWAFSFNVTRILGISLVVLSPVCVIGAEAVISFLVVGVQRLTKTTSEKNLPLYPVMCVFVIVWLLFQSEFIYAVAKEPVISSQAFNLEKDFTRFGYEDEVATAWLAKKAGGSPVVVDNFGRALVWAYLGGRNITTFSLNSEGKVKPPPEDAYILLRSYNTKHNLLGITSEHYVDLQALDLTGRVKIYDVGGVRIYK